MFNITNILSKFCTLVTINTIEKFCPSGDIIELLLCPFLSLGYLHSVP